MSEALGNVPRGCRGCVYREWILGGTFCAFLLATGRRRPCPPGAGCTVKRARTRHRTAKMKYDGETMARLHAAGASDSEIAAAVGMTKGGVRSWRKRNGLEANVPDRRGVRENGDYTGPREIEDFVGRGGANPAPEDDQRESEVKRVQRRRSGS